LPEMRLLQQMQFGLIHVYTGSGKGKTTASLGLSLRAIGSKYRIIIIQFLKKGNYSEIKPLRDILHIEVKQFGRHELVNLKDPSLIDKALAQKALRYATRVVKKGEYDMVVLDEVNVALSAGLVSLLRVLKLLNDKPWWVELVLTGRNAHQKVLEAADIVTEMREVKHPYTRGIKARKGIEF
jgi:cob(I)alamin adenosyltransferase